MTLYCMVPIYFEPWTFKVKEDDGFKPERETGFPENEKRIMALVNL